MNFLGKGLCLAVLLGFLVCCHFSAEIETAYRPSFEERSSIGNKEYFFGIHPLHNPERMQEFFGPIVDLLNEQIEGARFTLESSKDYEDYNVKITNRHFHFILPNPYQTLLAQRHGYKVFAKMGDDFNFKGIILVRSDGPIKTLLDLKRRKVGFPAQTALAASILPQMYLHRNGLDIRHDIKITYVGSQESSILSVLNKEVDAAATWPPPWKAMIRQKPNIGNQLKVIAETESLINNSLMSRGDLNSELVNEVRKIFVNLQNTKKGQVLLQKLELSKFEPADDERYKSVNAYIKKYNEIMGVNL
jgi:phosphonate transport system substrate-binding protein